LRLDPRPVAVQRSMEPITFGPVRNLNDRYRYRICPYEDQYCTDVISNLKLCVGVFSSLIHSCILLQDAALGQCSFIPSKLALSLARSLALPLSYPMPASSSIVAADFILRLILSDMPRSKEPWKREGGMTTHTQTHHTTQTHTHTHTIMHACIYVCKNI